MIIRYKKGFTLVELLVVIAIIALLLSILMPSLAKVRKQAQRVVCSTNLHQWSLALFAYQSDNKKLPETAWILSPAGRMPNAMWTESVVSTVDITEDKKKMITVEKIRPYLSGVDVVNKKIDGSVWCCPSFSKPNAQNAFMSRLWKSYGYFHTAYSYFACVKDWPVSAVGSTSRLYRELVDRDLDSSRLLMSDAIEASSVPLSAGGGWLYNHGENGPSQCAPYYSGVQVDFGPPKISGTNNLFGDGHIIWKGRRQFDLNGMQKGDRKTLPWIYGSGAPTGAGTFTY